MDEKNKICEFIKEKSNDKNFFCDYFELLNVLKIPIEDKDNTKLSTILIELKNENKIIAKEGEYLPKRIKI